MNLAEELAGLRRELHRHPELSMEERDTTRTIKAWLTRAGVPLREVPGLTTGVVAQIDGDAPGPTVALRADIDALPVEECTGLPFSSEVPGVMHACGHDVHTAVMAGAAKLLQECRGELCGSVRILFEPGEESASGGKWMAGLGVLEGVSAVFGCHNRPDLPVGTVGVREGALMAGVCRFSVDIEGRGGHAAMPETCADPIVAGAQLVGAFQTVVSRAVSPLENVAVSITQFHAGNTWNVIPGQARLEGTVRLLQPEAAPRVRERMQRITQGVAETNGVSARFSWEDCLPPVLNTPAFTPIVRRAAQLEGLQTVEARPNLGGEDFAVLQSLAPGYFVWLGGGGSAEWHHPDFTVDERALEPGARYFARLARLALELLQTPAA